MPVRGFTLADIAWMAESAPFLPGVGRSRAFAQGFDLTCRFLIGSGIHRDGGASSYRHAFRPSVVKSSGEVKATYLRGTVVILAMGNFLRPRARLRRYRRTEASIEI